MRLWERQPEQGRAHVYKFRNRWYAEWIDHHGQTMAQATFTFYTAWCIATEQLKRQTKTNQEGTTK